MKNYLLLVVLILLVGCTSTYPNKNVTGQPFPIVFGNTLSGERTQIPSFVKGDTVIFLIGYKQDSQFDIDRWLIGLDMKQVDTMAYELPTIAGLFPRMFSTMIDNGMRRGIPKELWGGVITIYQDGDTIQEFTGNESPNNARVMVINGNGDIVYFYDDGFSVAALNELILSL